MSRWKKYEDMTREEYFKARGMKMRYGGTYGGISSTSRAREDVYFYWDTGETYDITLDKLNSLFNEFSEFSGIPVKDLKINIKVESSYYDSYDKKLAFEYCIRKETDEEYEKRIQEVVIPHEKKEKEAAEKAKITKAERERKEYERLKTKYEGT